MGDGLSCVAQPTALLLRNPRERSPNKKKHDERGSSDSIHFRQVVVQDGNWGKLFLFFLWAIASGGGGGGGSAYEGARAERWLWIIPRTDTRRIQIVVSFLVRVRRGQQRRRG